MKMTIEDKINKYLVNEEDDGPEYECTECGAKFSSMPKDATCPKCGGEVEEMEYEEDDDEKE